MCPLNNIMSADVVAGCVAGIYNTYCTDPVNSTLLHHCHDTYNRVFAASFFKPLGAVCPAWKKGPRSSSCASAIATFSYNYWMGRDPASGQDRYIRLGSTHAQELVRNIFGSPIYAPCVAPVVCYW